VHAGTHGADPEAPRFTPGDLRGVLDRAVGRREELLDVNQEGGARGSEMGAILPMAEQSKADFALELLDLKIQRLRLDMEARGRAAEMQFLRNDPKVT